MTVLFCPCQTQGHKQSWVYQCYQRAVRDCIPAVPFTLLPLVLSLFHVQFYTCSRQPFWAHCPQAGSLTGPSQFPGGGMTGKWDVTLFKMFSTRATGDSWHAKVTLMGDIYGLVFFVGNSWVQKEKGNWTDRWELHNNRVGKPERI